VEESRIRELLDKFGVLKLFSIVDYEFNNMKLRAAFFEYNDATIHSTAKSLLKDMTLDGFCLNILP